MENGDTGEDKRKEEQSGIIEMLNLTEEEEQGVSKFLKAVDISVSDMKEVDDALNTEYYIPIDKPNPNMEQKKALYNTLQEFFSCFLVIGFDLEGNELFYQYAPNALALNGLNKKFQDVFKQYMIEETGMYDFSDDDILDEEG